MTLLAPPQSPGHGFDDERIPYAPFEVIIGKLDLLEWISQIQREFSPALCASESVARITRLVNALRFTLNGRVFALLRVDTGGLLFRKWQSNDTYLDFSQLSLDAARAIVKLTIAEALGHNYAAHPDQRAVRCPSEFRGGLKLICSNKAGNS
jgi:hypothetical protein